MTDNQVRSNRDIDALIMHGEFEIELNWGINQLAGYLQELDLLEKGAKFSDLGIGMRREECRPRVYSMQSGQPVIVNDPQVLRDSSITPAGSFAMLRLQGVMRSSSGASHQGIDELSDQFFAAYQNDNIAGVLLEVNSGGGESLAGSRLQSVIAESPKAVVVWAHMSASAAIRATAPADEIIASTEGAEVGSIGTLISVDRRFAQWYNSYVEDIYADKSTNKNKEFREFLRGNLDPLKANLNRSNEQFLAEVSRYRQLKHDPEHTLSGAMFTAREARRRGLIDGIGSFTYALSRLEANARRRKKAM